MRDIRPPFPPDDQGDAEEPGPLAWTARSMGARVDLEDEDALDVSLAAARLLAGGTQRHSLDEILERFGYSREELREGDGE